MRHRAGRPPVCHRPADGHRHRERCYGPAAGCSARLQRAAHLCREQPLRQCVARRPLRRGMDGRLCPDKGAAHAVAHRRQLLRIPRSGRHAHCRHSAGSHIDDVGQPSLPVCGVVSRLEQHRYFLQCQRFRGERLRFSHGKPQCHADNAHTEDSHDCQPEAGNDAAELPAAPERAARRHKGHCR